MSRDLALRPLPSDEVRQWVAGVVRRNPTFPKRPDAALVLDESHRAQLREWFTAVTEVWMTAPHPNEYVRLVVQDTDGWRCESWTEHHVRVSFLGEGGRTWVEVPMSDVHPQFAAAVAVLDSLREPLT